MTDSRIIDIDGIGPVLFEKSRRARRLVLSVKPPRKVRVAIPVRSSFKKAAEFVRANKEWVGKQLGKIEERETRNEPLKAAFRNLNIVKAKKTLKDRLSYLAAKHGFTFNKVTVRNQTTRWGSCSSKNNISLNLKLVLLPTELMDYVLLHELVHTRIHNHGKGFWDELDRYTGGGKKLAKRLKSGFSGLL